MAVRIEAIKARALATSLAGAKLVMKRELLTRISQVAAWAGIMFGMVYCATTSVLLVGGLFA